MLKSSAAAATVIALALGGGQAGSRPPSGPPPLPTGPVTVTGTITHHGVAVAGARLTFSLLDADPPRIREMATDADGRYRVVLNARGGYGIAIRFSVDGNSVTQSTRRLFMQAADMFDWEIPGAFVSVSLRDWDGRPAQISVFDKRGGPLRMSMITGVTTTPTMLLPPGEYQISARIRAGGASSNRVPFIVSETTVTVPVVLSLVKRTTSLELLDPRGEPLRTLSPRAVSVEPLGLRDADANGRVDLSAASPGDRLLITQDGFSPTCRVVPDSDQQMKVSLRTGIAAFVSTDEHQLLSGRLFSSDAGDCGVEVAKMFARNPSSEPRVEFDNFPTGPGYYVVTPSGTADVQVTASGRITVAWRARYPR